MTFREKSNSSRSVTSEQPSQALKICYRGSFLLIAEKPAGLPVHATLDPHRKNFADLVQAQEKLPYLRLVNRLDLDTTGLVLFCTDPEKNKEADEILSQAEKKYLCIVNRIPPEKSFREECFLKDGKGRVTAVRSGGKKAITDFKILSTNTASNISILEAALVTGRRHQIRFQIAAAGFPILGDTVYTPSDFRIKKTVPIPNRSLLHSYLLKFKTEEGIFARAISPLPDDFQKYLSFFPGISLPN
ncbi:RNA pseudouridine synthase [Leptospira inadai serovar Lyme str. 10]|uniref:RNA pseudouridine synthase n=2 Tax=Leptospira inadai serovar Lyme TaxID=293084 RepID=V6HDB9_9LEPT|nr:RNA pseudouridine synthase [Leptospira inadai]EQA37822.1 RNA pseudouridine synthase [Leptospira inadai serovar Lyme str. 10]PNV73343.1 RNA pseudouridine synthase [Leptospira inadai serovar Lyme]